MSNTRKTKKTKKKSRKSTEKASVKKKDDGDEAESEYFDSSQLDSSVMAMPLIEEMKGSDQECFDVVIDLNLNYPEGVSAAKEELIEDIIRLNSRYPSDEKNPIHQNSHYTTQYVFARLHRDAMTSLVEDDAFRVNECSSNLGCIYKIWPNFPVHPLLNRSVRTVKADAAKAAFGASGEGIVWAVIDTGIDAQHPHFETYGNLDLRELSNVMHMDFTGRSGGEVVQPADPHGHGTHVAGIIAGQRKFADDTDAGIALRRSGARRRRDHHGDISYEWREDIGPIESVAPQCKLVSLRALDSNARGNVHNIIAALSYINEINEFGRKIRIHGVNLSVGYEFNAEWFACGHSPVCIEVDRLVRSGVSVVIAAGNTGYGTNRPDFTGPNKASLDLSINDPGNAELGVTVGATHASSPYTYGVSYFSSKGPTSDGREKPDLVAPGERILSCAAGKKREDIEKKIKKNSSKASPVFYREHTGTSMAAPHVSGSIAAFLSIRQEFIGQPERVKEIFLASATDLKREPKFQGKGLVDLMRAIQSV